MKKIAVGLFFASLAFDAKATILLDDSFTGYTNGALVGQGSWTQVGTTATSPIQVSSGVVLMGQGSAQDADKDFSSSVTSGSIYYTATINVTSKNGTGDYALALSDGGTSGFSARLYLKSSGVGFALAWGGASTAPSTYGATLDFSTTYKIVLRYDIVSGVTNDIGKLYVTSGVFSATEAGNSVYQDVTSWTGGTELTSFSALLLRQGTDTGVLTIDNVRVGTSFAEVAVPEPSTYSALLGGGVLAGVVIRRRKRSVMNA